MNIFVLRHGLAVEPGTAGFSRDSDRPLTPKGRRKMSKITKAMKAMELSFDLMLSSPYVRARETAEIVAGAFKSSKRLKLTETLTPGGSVEKLIDLINEEKPKEVLLVGHEPYLSELISLLVYGDTRSLVVMKKGGLCKLAAEVLEPDRCASLEWLLTPKQMALMG